MGEFFVRGELPDQSQNQRNVSFRRGLDAEHVNRLGDVLDLLLARIDELDAEILAHLIPDRRGNRNAARLRQRLQPCRDIDAIAQDVVALDDNVAEVDTDAEFDLLVRSDVEIARPLNEIAL